MAYLEELLPEFRKGAKIRRKDWDNGAYLVFDTKYELIIDKEGRLLDFIHSDIISDEWEFYQEPIDYDYIIKNKCLCWFWCKDEEERKIAGYLADYDSYNSQFGRYKGKNVAVTYFDYCRPVRRDEVTFYEERKDEE